MMWVFGYGSLIWNPNFPYKRKIVGFIEGYKRCFWQGSTRYRGVPGDPGRVVTIVKDEKECVWGLAYEVASENEKQVKDYLDSRETGGYITETVQFWPQFDGDINKDDQKTPLDVLLYHSTPEGSNYLGPASIEDISRQIVRSVGPNGLTNKEYLFKLTDFMRTNAPKAKDPHLFQIEECVKQIINNNDSI